jgi:uncharacterized membrane protein YfcA
MTLGLVLTLLVLAMFGGFVSGLLGVGGAVVMIPLLLYVPPMLGVGALGMKAVAGATMVQVFVAALSGMLVHRRHDAVNQEVAWVGGLSMAGASLVGALFSYWVPDRSLLLVFALMVTAAGLLMLVPVDPEPSRAVVERGRSRRLRTILVCCGVGAAAGLVGAGGAFLLVPLLHVVVRVPIHVAIGTSLAIAALGAVTGVVGKLVTGQIPYSAAAVMALGAVPGARIGAAVSRRLSAFHLKLALGLAILAIGIRVWLDVLTG